MSSKSKTILTFVGVVIGITLVVASSYLIEYSLIPPLYATISMVVSMIVLFVAIFFAAKIDYQEGMYECRNCGHMFKPSFKAYICGPHSWTTRYLKCPNCEEKSWCKRK